MSVVSTAIDLPKMSLTRIVTFLASPGAPRSVIASPAIQRQEIKTEIETKTLSVTIQRPWYSSPDRLLDILVKWSGSIWMFSLLTASVLGWAFAGVALGGNTTWQVFISDYQALLTYFFDSLLMRQQLRDFDLHLGDYAMIRSRMHTHARLLERIQVEPSLNRRLNLDKGNTNLTFPVQPRFLRILTKAANTIGHLVFVGIFWIGIVIWLGFGHFEGWSNSWQLYCNSATSALMVILFAFLALVREEHSKYAQGCFDVIKKMDCRLEAALREKNDDCSPHCAITITFGESTGPVQRIINYYANLISMLMGIILLTAVVIIWISLGPTMEFGNSWWLLIGTYAGLIGMIDGFVLRNIDEQLLTTEKKEWTLIDQLENTVLARYSLHETDNDNVNPEKGLSTTNRISNTMNRMCAHRYAVLAGVMVALVLIIAASSLKWSFTGQLLCNVPPSVIESFFMIILISGHNDRNARKVEWCQKVYKRRIIMLAYVSESLDK